MGSKNNNGSLNSGRNAKGNKKNNTEKASARNGISKRRGPGLRVDRDGDLSMDASTMSKGPRQKNPSAPSTIRARAPLRNPKTTTKAQQVIERVMNGSRSAMASQVTTRTRGSRNVDTEPLVTLMVEGLKSSKAASNEGGGLRELLTFLERKAQTVSGNTRTIRIKKVCCEALPTGLGGYEATQILRNRYYAT
jgi:nuclear RNA export factor